MNLLLTGAFAWRAEELTQLENMGHRVAFLQQEKEPLPCEPDWVEGVVCNGLFLHHPIDSFSNLRYIQLTSAGFDRVDMDHIREKGIEIHNARGVYSIPMAEFALSGVLAVYKQAAFFRERQRAGVWEKHRKIRELAGKTVGILGCGSVGTECARRFAALGCRVQGVDAAPYISPWYEKMEALEALEALLPQWDIAVLTLPLTEQTRHLMDASRLALLRDGAVLVNIARGAVVDQQALIKELESGRLFGVLDVFAQEPLAEESPLWALKNAVITPHNSFVGEGNHERMWEVILRNIKEV